MHAHSLEGAVRGEEEGRVLEIGLVCEDADVLGEERAGTGRASRNDPNSPTGLYNLRDDAGEQNDLSKQNPDKLRELEAAWAEWNKGNVPASWGPVEQFGPDGKKLPVKAN